VSAVGSIQTVFANDPTLRYVPNSGTLTATIHSATGNVVAGNVRTVGQVSATGNVTGGNLVTVGNVSGNFILGNGSQLTGLALSTNTIQNGNSNVLVGTANGNVSINVRGVSPLAIFTPLGQTTTGIISATGTITGGNLATGGNVTGAFIYGNGSQLSGLPRSLTVGTRTTPVSIVLTGGGSFNVGTRSSGNVTVTTST
jgi:hypothetical protein